MKGVAIASFLLLSSVFMSFVVEMGRGDDSSLQTKCAPEFTKLTVCLDYASAKVDTPSSSCCSSVKDIRGADPVCLCYIIQQTHDGLSSLTSLGLQFDRLLQLPATCSLANSSVSECPKLLNLPPSSPDSAIFANPAKASSSTTPAKSTPKSKAVMHQVSLAASFTIAVISAIFLSIFSYGT